MLPILEPTCYCSVNFTQLIYTAKQTFSTDIISYPGLNEYEIFYLVSINKYGDLKINVFFVTVRQNIIWLGVSGLTLLFMPCACKGYKPTSKIKTFNSNVKHKVLNGKKR